MVLEATDTNRGGRVLRLNARWYGGGKIGNVPGPVRVRVLRTGGRSTGCVRAQLNYGSPQTESRVFGVLSQGPAKLGFNKAIGLISGFKPSGQKGADDGGRSRVLEYHGRGPYAWPWPGYFKNIKY